MIELENEVVGVAQLGIGDVGHEHDFGNGEVFYPGVAIAFDSEEVAMRRGSV